MIKLRKKVFWTIYGITAGIIFVVVLIYNVSNYLNTKAMLLDAAMSPFVDPRYADFIAQGFFNNLWSSLFIFIVFAIVLYFVSKKITEWIVRPAEDAFSKQKDFIADASHELKTPLSVIIASSDALEKNPKETKWVKNIQEEAARMNTLIAKLLELASTEKVSEDYFVQGNLSKIVELSALTFEGRALASECKVKIDIEENILYKFNENDIKQLVEILLDNAIKHSEKKSTVELNLNKENGKIMLRVINQGEAIDKGDEEKIFERFYRADKVRDAKEKRYGLGLAIAKNICSNHHGTITAASHDGKTTFTVTL